MKLNVNMLQRSYDVVIERGVMAQVGEWAADLWKPQKIVLISDDHVNHLYGREVIQNLRSSGFDVSVFEFPEGEVSKEIKTVEKAWDFLADQGLTRSDGIVALGGGVTGDLAGFIASTYLRGIHFLQIPTSLTAQVDSSIGGKTGINSKVSKNMIGTFLQPDGVLIDPTVLDTLNIRCLREGIAEVIKCGLIADDQLWNKLDKMTDERELLKNDIESIIYASCDVKRKAIVADELDNGIRLSLNFGHTIGHALEVTAGYGKLLHGEAVAIGMVQISKVAEQKGLISKGMTKEIQEMVQKFGLPSTYEPWDEALLFQAVKHDKKARGNMISIILVPKIGRSMIYPITFETMNEYIKK